MSYLCLFCPEGVVEFMFGGFRLSLLAPTPPPSRWGLVCSGVSSLFLVVGSAAAGTDQWLGEGLSRHTSWGLATCYCHAECPLC